MDRVLRHTVRILAVLVAVLALPAAVAPVSATAAFGAYYAPGPQRPVPAAAPVRHDPAKPTAVVVVGAVGAEVSDTLAPYEILAATDRFNVYTVGPQRTPVTLTGGLDLVPDLTFDELAELADPALVVVPALPDLGEPTTAPVTEWLAAQAGRGARLLSICNGAGVLASAGLLDGRPAAAHWMQLRGMQAEYPQVRWVPGRRFVDDGDVVSTAGILSGIDGTLHVVERMLGPAVARDAATAIGWRHYGADSPVHTGPPVPDPAVILNGGFLPDPPTVGVALTDGVGELALAAVFNTQARSLATRALAVSDDGGPVRSRHGLTFLPRAELAGAAPRLDRLIVPGGGPVAPVPGAPQPEYLPQDRFAFDATVADLAATTDVATARWVAKVLELPDDDLALDGPAWPWLPTLVLAALVLVGLLLHQIIAKILDRRRGRGHTQSAWRTQHRPRPNPS